VRSIEPDDNAAESNIAMFERVAMVPRFIHSTEAAAERREQQAIEAAILKMDVSAVLEDEFGDQRGMLSRAFPWIFCLGGIMAMPTSAGPLSVMACRHLLLQHTCAAAHDHDLVFLIADQKRRHASCRGASSEKKSGKAEFH